MKGCDQKIITKLEESKRWPDKTDVFKNNSILDDTAVTLVIAKFPEDFYL